MRQIARRTAQPGTEIDDLAADGDPRAFRQRIVGDKPAIVILVVREQIVRAQSLERAARRLELGEDDLRRYRMAVVEVDRRADLRGHHRPHGEPGLDCTLAQFGGSPLLRGPRLLRKLTITHKHVSTDDY